MYHATIIDSDSMIILVWTWMSKIWLKHVFLNGSIEYKRALLHINFPINASQRRSKDTGDTKSKMILINYV